MVALLAGCSFGSNGLPSSRCGTPFARDAVLQAMTAHGAGKIKHVVIIVQENRSFDNLFQGYPGADTVPSGKNSKGQTIRSSR